MSGVMGTKKVVLLSCAVQNYGWGKIGENSKVAQLVKNQSGFAVNNEAPYAELWMGTHPNGPSKVLGASDGDELHLQDLIKSDPSFLGGNIINKFGVNLPYLFKVLSINKSLSIQAHPTKEHAQQLHKDRPDIYKDPNHKPEMAIALTKFESLCGFRPVQEIVKFLQELEEFSCVVGQESVNNLISSGASQESNKIREALSQCVLSLMQRETKDVELQLTNLVKKFEKCHVDGEDTASRLGHLFLRVHSEYPGDVGCFMIYFLNYVQLEPFESIFLGPNIPHSYISGDIIECMACSDNVIRAGLTPKYKDVSTLINMLDYTPRTVAETKFQPTTSADVPCESVYDPPVDDFSVKVIKIPAGSKEYKMKAINGPSICLVISGGANLNYNNNEDSLKVQSGSVCFVSPNEQVCLNDILSSEEFLMFQAYCEI